MLAHKIIQVVPTEQVFSITWNLGNRCNYDCMYCPSEWHSSRTPHKGINELKQIWIDIFNKSKDKNLNYKISLTGGEVTSNKDLVPFLQWLRTEYSSRIHKVLLTTNGSASLNYYKELYTLVDNISFSVHSEHINEVAFFNKMLLLRKRLPLSKHIHVNIMDEAWNQDRIKLYCKILDEYKVSYSVNKINYSRQHRSTPIFKGKLNLGME